MEVNMNELNSWFHDHKAKRESYTALQSVELKFTSENGNCNKCSKFQLLSTHVYLTFLAFSILHYVLGFNLSENPRWTATFSTRHVGIHLFTIKKDWMIFSGVAWKGHLTDKLLFNTNNETLQPWLVNDRYKMCYSMPTYCYNGKTNKECGLHIKYTPWQLEWRASSMYCDSSYP